VDANKKVSEEANNLARALKSESKTAGNWGEMILESILEKSGLVKGREYFMQESGRTEDRRIVYPDVVVKYPGDRFVVIDSKLSLNAYERYQSFDDKVQQEQAIKGAPALCKGAYHEPQFKKLPGALRIEEPGFYHDVHSH
jgi:DNA recombination protein RmuC